VDAESGIITNLTTGKTFQATPFPAFINRIIENGGLLPYLVKKQGGDSQ
jgi:3-isopropylmalate/(R)-2-methylmalate dehydratase small subunit